MPALLLLTVTGFSGYAALLTAAPLWAVHGGADEAGSGLVNGVLLIATVLTQFLVPAALRRWGWAPVMVTGMVLMGLAALGHIGSDQIGPVLALSVVRGVGFGILTVTGSAAVPELVPAARRGAAIGLYGLAIALPNVLLLPAAPWAAQHWGFPVVFAVAGLPLLGVPAAIRLARALPQRPHEVIETPQPVGDAATAAPDPDQPLGAAYRRLARPTLLLLAVTFAGGALITFTAQMVPGTVLAGVALLVMGLTAAVARWGIGMLSDRHGPHRFLLGFVLAGVVGVALLAWSVQLGAAGPGPVALLMVGMALLGTAYGGLQNLTLVVAFEQVARRHFQTASAVWNAGFDLGTALGAMLVGVIAVRFDFPVALLVTAAVCALTVPLALHRRD